MAELEAAWRSKLQSQARESAASERRRGRHDDSDSDSTRDVGEASIVMLETEVPADTFGEFSRLLDACKEGCRLLTYLDLRRVWRLPGQPFPFRQLEANRSFADRYPTSWSVQRGHHLFLWVKVLKPGAAGLASKEVFRQLARPFMFGEKTSDGLEYGAKHIANLGAPPNAARAASSLSA